MLDADAQLAAEAAADAGHDHAHLVGRQVEHLGQQVLHVEGSWVLHHTLTSPLPSQLATAVRGSV